MMDPTREPTANRDNLSDDAVVTFLRTRAPGLPAAQFDPRTVTAHARGALRRRRIRNSVVAVACTATVYLGLALAGPLPVPGGGTVSVPGSHAVRALVAGSIPGRAPGPDKWQDDVDRLEAEVLPVLQRLQVGYYLREEDPCRILKYSRGDYSDQDNCEEMTPFDGQASADFDEVTDAIERSGVPVFRIGYLGGGLYFQLKDQSWQYNWEYVRLANVAGPPPINFPEEEWTRVRGDWWFHRAHDD